MKKSYLLFATLVFMFSFAANQAEAQCLTWSAPTPPSTYNDFNNIFGGAPCDAGAGCPFNEITSFEVYASEAYICNNFKLAASTLSASAMAQGRALGCPSLPYSPPVALLMPSVPATVTVVPSPGQLRKTVLTPSSSTKLGIVRGGPNTSTNNGYPALTCISGAVCPTTPCAAGQLTTTAPVSVCGPGATFDIATDGTEVIPPNGGHGWFFNDELGGTGGLAGGFTLTGVPASGTFDSDLNGVLSTNSLPLLAGTWVIKSVTYILASNPSGTVCSTSTDSLIVSFSPTAPPTVTVVDNGNSSATATATGGTSPTPICGQMAKPRRLLRHCPLATTPWS
ncbi:MAG: hypothetical protein IPM82_03600 [Saprospiraceae bacterium]|nr:hypothetical protein [Saprospiraceae bacterium]